MHAYVYNKDVLRLTNYICTILLLDNIICTCTTWSADYWHQGVAMWRGRSVVVAELLRIELWRGDCWEVFVTMAITIPVTIALLLSSSVMHRFIIQETAQWACCISSCEC